VLPNEIRLKLRRVALTVTNGWPPKKSGAASFRRLLGRWPSGILVSASNRSVHETVSFIDEPSLLNREIVNGHSSEVPKGRPERMPFIGCGHHHWPSREQVPERPQRPSIAKPVRELLHYCADL
jgi:hypothetical protein